MTNIVLNAENISKYYRLGQLNNGTFFRDLQSWYAQKRHRVDPNSKIDDKVKMGEGFWALKDINFSIERGERVGIIGKNGAGKSTLLKIISEITAPTTGVIKVKGRVASLLEVGTGFHQEMTGRENIYLNGAILGMKKAEIDKKIDEIIDFSEISEHIDTPVKRYSSGMYVRLAFAVAANLDSDILIADEVLAVGDAAFQKKAIGKMNAISREDGKTVLFVSHNMNAVRGLCKTGILIDKGIIKNRGAINDVIEEYFEKPFQNGDERIETKINNLPVDTSFQFDSIYIEQNGKRISETVLSSMPIDIEISYTVKKPEIGLRIYFDLCDSAGEILFRSFNDEDGEGASNQITGKYKSVVTIPADVLGGTRYIIVFRAGIFNVRNCTGDGVRIPLSVILDGKYNRAYPNDTFRGKLGLYLKWNNQYIYS